MAQTTRTLWIILLAQAALAASPTKDGLPVFFIANQGQAPPTIRYMAKGSGLSAYFSTDDVLLRRPGFAVDMRFEDANPAASLEGIDGLPARANFLTGDAEQWRVGVPTFGKVTYRNLYPGIDLVYGAEGHNLKSDYRVAVGADPSRIRVRYAGARPRVDTDGALLIEMDGQVLREAPPRIYQVRDGKEIEIAGRFQVADDGAVSFQLAQYDRSRELVIDPVMQYSTLLGGSGFDTATSIAVDSAGSAYVAGYTDSYNFPTSNPEQSSNSGGNEVFVAKLNASGNGLVYCTYIGGSGDDRAFGIAVDGSGSAYVTGWTGSLNFPTRSALQSRLQGSRNAFIAKLTPAGNAFVFSTYLGGNGVDSGNGIAVDGSGNVFITGDTTSINFPATGFQKGIHGGQDAFVTKLSADGGRIVYSTYLGGSSVDHGAGIAVTSSGSAYVTGSTYSADFPTSQALQSNLAGGGDAFVARLSTDGANLVFSTYLGGSGGTVSYPESGQGIALDSQGSAYLVGVTASADFPLSHAVQTARSGSLDAFVTKLNSAGALVYSTYLGGSGVEVGNAIAVDSTGAAYVVGYTYSTDLPVANPIQAQIAGDCDAFLAKLNSAGDSVVYLSYLGGNSSDTATAVAVDAAGNAYVAGWTLSTNFPLVNPYQSINSGNYGAYVAKVVLAQAPVLVAVSPASGTGATQTFSLQYSDSAGATNLTSVSLLVNSSLSTSYSCDVMYDRTRNTLALMTNSGALPASTITPGSGSQSNGQCTLNGAGSSVTLVGSTLTLSVSLSFFPAFAGAKAVYMQATNPSGTAAWKSMGAWTVGATSQVVSVSPASGTGTVQSFSFQYTDTAGAGDLTTVMAMFNTVITAANGCWVNYGRADNTLWLLTDSGGVPTGVINPGSGSQQNSQCVLDGTGTSVTLSGNTLTLNVSITFKSAFAGAKNVYLKAVSPFSVANWTQKGNWTVGATVQAVSVSPGSGTGSGQTFTFQVTDTAGATDLNTVSALFNSSTSAVNACEVVYNRTANTLALLNDAGLQAGTITPGSGSQQNSQCALNGSGSGVSISGTTLTLYVALTFQPAFVGTRNSYLQATGILGSVAWQQKGTWIIPTSLQAVSVSPNSGTGVTQSFTFQFSDSAGATDLTTVSVLFNSTLSTSYGCSVAFDRTRNTLALLSNTGATGSTITPGSGSQQNSQCTLNGVGSSATVSGTTLTLSLSVTFLPAFAGSKTIYMQAANASANTGWASAGTWTVSATTSAVSVSPGSGTGASQIFAFQYSDTAGATDLTTVMAMFNTVVTSANGCWINYAPAQNTLWLMTDSGAVPPGTINPGSGSQENSQCILNGSGTSATLAGNVLTLNLSLTFKPAFNGARNVYMKAVSPFSIANWLQRGSWTVTSDTGSMVAAPSSAAAPKGGSALSAPRH